MPIREIQSYQSGR